MESRQPHKTLSSPRAILAILATAIALASPVASEAGNWELTSSVGAITEPVYPGSNRNYVAPFVDLRVETRRGAWSFSGSVMQGLEFSWVNSQRRLLASLQVNQGDERRRDVYSVAGFEFDHSRSTLQLLGGSPDLSNPVNGTLFVGYLSTVGIVGGAVTYAPTSVTAAGGKSTRHGVLASLQYMRMMPVGGRTEVSTLVRLNFMDGVAADTWYSAEALPGVRDAYRADAGVRDLSIATQMEYDLSASVSLAGIVAHTRLLGDAASSPFTTARGQTTALLLANYHF